MLDDLFLMLFDNIVDHVNRQHLEYLRDYLVRLVMMYERGQLSKDIFEETKAKVLKSIEAHSLHLETSVAPKKSLELGL